MATALADAWPRRWQMTARGKGHLCVHPRSLIASVSYLPDKASS